MTSLEFINLEIAKAKSDYKKHINFDQTSFAIAIEKRLKDLYQIKVELEAWEATKRELVLEIIEHYNDTFKTKYALKCDYQGLIPLLDKEVESFKKALEVKNE